MNISLLVIRSKNIDTSKDFYEEILRLKFNAEKHGNGPEHFSTIIDGTVFEIYPKGRLETTGLRLGFKIEDIELCIKRLRERDISFEHNGDSIVIVDPDGHKIEISAKD